MTTDAKIITCCVCRSPMPAGKAPDGFDGPDENGVWWRTDIRGNTTWTRFMCSEPCQKFLPSPTRNGAPRSPAAIADDIVAERILAPPATCQDLGDFLVGELSAQFAERFRQHLPGCPACQAELTKTSALLAQLSTMPPPKES